MAIEKAIRNYLLANATVSALIARRYDPEVLPQTWKPSDGPYVVYTIIDSQDEHTLYDRVGLVHARFQITTYAGSRLVANATARAMKNSGIAAIRGTYDGVVIRSIEIESGLRTEVEKQDDGSANYIYVAEFDLMAHYLEG